MKSIKNNNLIKKLSLKAIAGLIFGIAAIIGVVMVTAFTEPASGPAGFSEPADAQDKGDWFAHGRGWVKNASGAGSTALTKTACDAAYSSDNYYWQWFEDGNGDGDTTDEEDGICVLMCVGAGCTDTANNSNDGYLSDSWNGAEQVDDIEKYDNTWIGDWTCTSTFPNGTVVFDEYPTSTTNHVALATADCLDGKRNLLPVVDESSSDSRIVYSATATTATATTLTDSAATWTANMWDTQKVKIFAGTSVGSEGTISSNTDTILTVASWSSGTPDETSQYGIIYIKPNDTGSLTGYNGPLNSEVLNDWKGTRLPTRTDFFGVCGSSSSDTTIGISGTQVGRTDEYLNEAGDSVNEWLSEQHGCSDALMAGNNACSFLSSSNVIAGYSFRAVFRP